MPMSRDHFRSTCLGQLVAQHQYRRPDKVHDAALDREAVGVGVELVPPEEVGEPVRY